MNINGPLHIAYDVDGVLADIWHSYDARLDEYGDESADIPRGHDPRNVNWNLKTDRTPREKRIIDEVMAKPGFFGSFPPIPGAVRVIRELRDRGHHVTVATAPYASNPTCASDKLAWVGRVHGQRLRNLTYIASDKTGLRADVLLDDKAEITGHDEPMWKHLLFGNYPYNAHKSGLRLLEHTTAAAVLELIREL